MRKLSACALGLVFAVALAPALDAPLAAAAHPSTTSRTSSIAYPGCPAGSVSVTVTVPRAPVPSGVPVRYGVTLRNTGSQVCGPSNATTTVSGRHSSAGLELFGECGTFPVVIDDRHGQRVYPPFLAIMCPYRVAPKLSAGAAVTSAQSWNQMEGGGRPARRAQLAPAGIYQVTVADTPRATFRLAPRVAAPSSPIPSPTGLPSSG